MNLRGPAAIFLLLILGGLALFGRGVGRGVVTRADPTARPRPITTFRPTTIVTPPSPTAVPRPIGRALIDIDINGGARTTRTVEGPTANGRFILFPGAARINGNGGVTATPTRTTPTRTPVRTPAPTRVEGPVFDGRFALFPGADRIQ